MRKVTAIIRVIIALVFVIRIHSSSLAAIARKSARIENGREQKRNDGTDRDPQQITRMSTPPCVCHHKLDTRQNQDKGQNQGDQEHKEVDEYQDGHGETEHTAFETADGNAGQPDQKAPTAGNEE